MNSSFWNAMKITFAAIALISSVSSAAMAQSQGPISIANNDSLFIDGTKHTITQGKAKGDISAELKKLGARELGPAALIIRHGDKLYLANNPYVTNTAHMVDPGLATWQAVDPARNQSYAADPARNQSYAVDPARSQSQYAVDPARNQSYAVDPARSQSQYAVDPARNQSQYAVDPARGVSVYIYAVDPARNQSYAIDPARNQSYAMDPARNQ